MNVYKIILSNFQNFRLWSEIKKTIDKDYVILTGGSNKRKLEDNILYVDSNNKFDILLKGIQLMISEDIYSNYTHFFIINDEDFLTELDVNNNIDYGENIVTSGCNKIVDIFAGCLLSQKSMKILSSNQKISNEKISIILTNENIIPEQINFKINKHQHQYSFDSNLFLIENVKRLEFVNKIQRTEVNLEDISLIKYKTPIIDDMAIGIVIFNPSNSKRLIMNYLFMVEKLKLAKIPYYVLELVYKNKTPEINDAFYVYSDKYSFCKEQLMRILETKIPNKYNKLCFLDGDLIFTNLNWYNEISDLLNSFNIIHHFCNYYDIDITYTKKSTKKMTTVLHYRTKKNIINFEKFHPGLGCAFQRDWYNKVGFFDYALLGAGDIVSLIKFCNLPDCSNVSLYFDTTFYRDFIKKLASYPPSISFINGDIYHLFHGPKNKRQYSSRYDIIKGRNIETLVEKKENGIFEFIDEEINKKIKEYFNNRSDDLF